MEIENVLRQIRAAEKSNVFQDKYYDDMIVYELDRVNSKKEQEK